ncbi:hypothetical protein, partial [Bartonella sp. MU70NMGDW]|uniref:hypothetical protein n=1 Tax=Bartonella sp. MU70NMGDW TaxID=3243561 RepID=UPI0035D0738F
VFTEMGEGAMMGKCLKFLASCQGYPVRELLVSAKAKTFRCIEFFSNSCSSIEHPYLHAL